MKSSEPSDSQSQRIHDRSLETVLLDYRTAWLRVAGVEDVAVVESPEDSHLVVTVSGENSDNLAIPTSVEGYPVRIETARPPAQR